MYSVVDEKGRLNVDCSECDRGGNGSAKDKCACGWQVKKPRQGSCYLGTIMNKYQREYEEIKTGTHPIRDYRAVVTIHNGPRKGTHVLCDAGYDHESCAKYIQCEQAACKNLNDQTGMMFCTDTDGITL